MSKWLFLFFLLVSFGCSSNPSTKSAEKSPFKEWNIEFVKKTLGEPIETKKDGIKKTLQYKSILFLYDDDSDELMTVQFIHPRFRQNLVTKKAEVFLSILPVELNFNQTSKQVEAIFGKTADKISKATNLRNRILLHYFNAKTGEEEKPFKPDWRNTVLRFTNSRLNFISVSILSPDDPTFGVE